MTTCRDFRSFTQVGDRNGKRCRTESSEDGTGSCISAQDAKIALKLYDKERENEKAIEQFLAVGELIKKHASEENAVIYDVTEYLYEQLRAIREDNSKYDTSELRRQIEEVIQ